MPLLTSSNGITIETYAPPPAGVDLASASKADLATFGLHGFDDTPELHRQVTSVLRGYRFIQPSFQPRKVPFDRPPHFTAEAAPIPSQAWSGASLSAAAGDPICWVQGGWSVPSVAAPPNGPGGLAYAAASWIGIDGMRGSEDILQTGFDALVAPDNSVHYRLWTEWFPWDANYIPNMPIFAGDTFTATIKLYPGSNTSAVIVLANQSKRVACNFTVNAKPGFPLVGNCAEWIVESQPQLGRLVNFGMLNFTGCQAGSVSGATAGVGSASPILMVNAARQVLSAGEVASADNVRVRFVQA